MNRRKHTSSLGFPSLVLLAIAVIIVSSSGIAYVVMKNKQITTRGKIAAVQKKMDEHQVSISLHKADIEETLGVYTLREHLAESNSPLTEIKFVEVFQDSGDDSPPDGSVARR